MNYNHIRIGDRNYSVNNSVHSECSLDPNKNHLFDLSYLSILDVKGDNALSFLQGQLTCDIRDLNSLQAVQGIQCNLKGRILSLLDIIDWQGTKLVLPNDLIPATQSSLATTAMLSRVTLVPNNQLKLFGFALNNSEDIFPFDLNSTHFSESNITASDYCIYLQGHNLYIIAVQNDSAEKIASLVQDFTINGSLGWHFLQLKNGNPEIYPQTRGSFLPHRIDFHKTKRISFNKGCYKGQEIIARTHYKAKIKHGVRLITKQTVTPPQLGQALYDAGSSQEIGELIDFCPIADDSYLLLCSMLLDRSDDISLVNH